MSFPLTHKMYGDGKAEIALGNCITKGIKEGVWKRSDLVISTKLFKGGEGINEIGRLGMGDTQLIRFV